MQRLLVGALRLFVLLAVVGHYMEHLGVTHCGCAPECWCKKPVLGFFRWVIPWGHRFPAHTEAEAQRGVTPGTP